MKLVLNEVNQIYKEYIGKKTVQLRKIKDDERVPISNAQLMTRRLEVWNSNEEIKNSYFNYSFDTGDSIIKYSDIEIVIDLDSQYLRNVTSRSPRNKNNGSLLLSENIDEANAIYEELKKQPDVIVFDKRDKRKLKNLNRWLKKEEVKTDPLFRVIARERSLLNDYTDFIFSEGKKEFNYDRMMGIFLASDKGILPEMRTLCFCNLECRSAINGGDNIDARGYLIGVDLEALSAKDKIFPRMYKSHVRSFTKEDLDAFDNATNQLEKILNPELLNPILDLREKL